MDILVTRHGQTDWNVLGKLQGKTDIELNNTGRMQAEEVGKSIQNERIDLIITSPLKRAKETAQIINKSLNVPIIEDERIIERGFGDYEGVTLVDFDKQKVLYPQCNELWNYPLNVEINNVETMHDFFARVYNFFDEITEKYNDKRILVVAHGGTSVPIKCYFNKIQLNEFTNKKLLGNFSNCQVLKFNV